ncbi:MAG: ethylbenzene dehydrogenase-related protein [Sulfurovaceae bacterium]
MRRIDMIKKLTLGLMFFAASSLFAEPAITAIKVSNSIDLSKTKPNDAIWSKAKPSTIICYPQTTIKLNDKKANELNAQNKAKVANISAIYNVHSLAFKITWNDATQNIQLPQKSDIYGDGVAVQFAQKFDDPKKLPYIGMGSKDREVLIYLQKAVEKYFEPNKDIEHQVSRDNTNAFGNDLKKYDAAVKALAINEYHKVFVGEGFRSMTQVRSDYGKLGMDLSYKSGKWSAVFTKPMSDEYVDISKAGAIPASFALWDGDKLGRDGLKYLSSWVAVKFQGKKGGDALVDELTSEPTGDVQAGEAQVKAMCASCHRFADQNAAPAAMGPALYNIGGYSTSAYLAESIKEPNAVVVPGYNRNAHKSFSWYSVDDNGTRTTTMPPMMSDDKSIADAVAYLKTLKAEVEK